MYNMDELSVCLQKLPIGCCRSDMVVNANDIVLLAPSARDAKYYKSYVCISNYGNAYDIVFNITKSQVMF